MNSPLTWTGGKSKLTSKIIPLIPPHKIYGEAFAGAGWVFFRKEHSKFESLNDINGDLVNFYRVLQHHFEEFCKQFKWLLSSRQTFDDYKAQMEEPGLTDIQRAARFYYLQRHCFGGKVVGRTFGVAASKRPPINLIRLETELSEAHLRLSGVTVENLPWDNYLQRYDKPETFFYLDPPYYGTENYYGKDLFPRSEFARMAEVLSELQGKFLLSLNDCPEIREIFKDFRIHSTETMYSSNSKKNIKAKEVFIMNYAPAQ